MRLVLMAIGGLCLLLFALGAIDLIDFHICVKPAGQCAALQAKDGAR